jgi:hypothetical protein
MKGNTFFDKGHMAEQIAQSNLSAIRGFNAWQKLTGV